MSRPAVETWAPLDVSGRLDRLRGLFDAAGPDDGPLDALLVTTPANIRWLSGFTGSAGLLLVTRSEALLTTDGRYRTQSGQQLDSAGVGADIEVRIGGVQAQRDAVVAASAGAGTVGLEADHVTWSAQRSWAELFDGVRLAPTTGVLERLRMVKDAGEIVRMERAAAIADAALGRGPAQADRSGRADPVGQGAAGADRVPVRGALGPCHAGAGGRGERLRDHRGLG